MSNNFFFKFLLFLVHQPVAPITAQDFTQGLATVQQEFIDDELEPLIPDSFESFLEQQRLKEMLGEVATQQGDLKFPWEQGEDVIKDYI